MHKAKAYGFLGGSFDPIHKGHLNLAKGVRRSLKLDKIFLIPNAAPPHKAGNYTSYKSRLQMTDLALLSLNHRQYQVSRLEQDPEHRHYTYDTLKMLRQKYGPDTRLYFIMGMDSLLDLDTWHKGFELTDFANLAVIDRPGSDFANCPKAELKAYIADHVVYEPAPYSGIEKLEEFNQALNEPKGRIFILRVPVMDVSSTQLRAELARVSAQRSLRELELEDSADPAQLSKRDAAVLSDRHSASDSSETTVFTGTLQHAVTPQVLRYIQSRRLYQKDK